MPPMHLFTQTPSSFRLLKRGALPSRVGFEVKNRCSHARSWQPVDRPAGSRTQLCLSRPPVAWPDSSNQSWEGLADDRCPTLRRPPLPTATHMNATLHPQRAYRRTTDRTSYNQPSPDDSMAHRSATLLDKSTPNLRFLGLRLPYS